MNGANVDKFYNSSSYILTLNIIHPFLSSFGWQFHYFFWFALNYWRQFVEFNVFRFIISISTAIYYARPNHPSPRQPPDTSRLTAKQRGQACPLVPSSEFTSFSMMWMKWLTILFWRSDIQQCGQFYQNNWDCTSILAAFITQLSFDSISCFNVSI